jgi:hypothetical protein
LEIFPVGNPKETLNIHPLHRNLARHILELNQGDRLPSIRELADLLDTSVGSVSQSLNDLEALGCISISRRGRMGSYLEDISIGPLWTVTETCPLIGGLTLASNLRYEGLATALKTMLATAGIETYMMFIRGSRNRLKALQDNRCHYVVVSSFAAHSIPAANTQILMVLPPTSFVSRHRVFYNANSSMSGKPLKIGIDHDSYDQAVLTEMEFEGQEVDFVSLNFTQIERFLCSGIVDCAVWTEDDMKQRSDPNILDRPLSAHVRDVVKEQDTCAALVALSKNEAVHAVIKHAFDEGELLRIQESVMEGRILPEY